MAVLERTAAPQVRKSFAQHVLFNRARVATEAPESLPMLLRRPMRGSMITLTSTPKFGSGPLNFMVRHGTGQQTAGPSMQLYSAGKMQGKVRPSPPIRANTFSAVSA
jgi:hypothetical protein